MGRLRRALGREAVASAPGGYRLARTGTTSTSSASSGSPARGSAALDAGTPARPPVLLDEALALWHGPALADLPDRDGDPRPCARSSATPGAPHPARGRGLGWAGPARSPSSTALAARAPHWTNRSRRSGSRALRDGGTAAEALQPYEEIRVRLADRLGTDPGRELRALHAELLAPDDRADPPAPAPLVPAPRTPATSAPGSPPSSAARPTSAPSRGDLRAPGSSPCSAPAAPGKTRLSPGGRRARGRDLAGRGLAGRTRPRTTTRRPFPRPC